MDEIVYDENDYDESPGFTGNCYRDIYKILFPAVVLKAQRDQPITDEKYQDMDNYERNIPLPPNKFLYKEYPGAKDKPLDFIVRPNFDTSYCIAYLDVKKTPVIVNIPKIEDIPDQYGGGKRFWGVQMMNGWTDTFSSTGIENNDTEGSYIVTGPSWRNKNNLTNPYTPATLRLICVLLLIVFFMVMLSSCITFIKSPIKNLLLLTLIVCILILVIAGSRKWKKVIDSDTDFVWIIVRIQANGPEDADKNVFEMQRNFTIDLYDKTLQKQIDEDYYELGMMIPGSKYLNVCETDNDCDIDSRCVNAACEKYDLNNCRGPLDCPVDAMCDLDTHTCKYYPQCDNDRNCDFGFFCNQDSQTCEKITVPIFGKCESDLECKETGYCDLARNKCKPRPCRVTEECPENNICDEKKHVCNPQRLNISCDTTNDCGPNQYCYQGSGIDDLDRNKCMDLPDYCDFDGEKDKEGYVNCPDGYTCNYKHLCEPKPGTICYIDKDCIDQEGKQCNQHTNTCVVPKNCNDDYECETNQKCNNMAIHNKDGTTGKCQTMTCIPDENDRYKGCKDGAYCEDGLCKVTTVDSCKSDDDCTKRNMFCNTDLDKPKCQYLPSNKETIERVSVVNKNKVVFDMTPEYFYVLASWLVRNYCQFTPFDKYKIELLKNINFLPSSDDPRLSIFDWKKLDLNTKLNLIGAAKGGKASILATVLTMNKKYTDASQWSNWRNIGTYGKDYDSRVAIAYEGLGANPGKTAVYMNCRKDSSITDKLTLRSKLNGKRHAYEMVFNGGGCGAGSIDPPVKGFWSLTAYDADGFIQADPEHSHIGNATGMKAIEYEPDGTFSIYLSPTNKDNRKNWLQVPDKEFSLLARFYLPDKDIINGDWFPPSVDISYGCVSQDVKSLFRHAFTKDKDTRSKCVESINKDEKALDHKLKKTGCTKKQIYDFCPDR